MTAPEQVIVTQADIELVERVRYAVAAPDGKAFLTRKAGLTRYDMRRILAALQATRAAEARIAGLVEALGTAREALCNHACHSGSSVPCRRSPDQCAADCGREAGDAIVAVDAILATTKAAEEPTP